MSLHFSVLASGSTGNAFYIGTDQTKLLVNAGLSGKKLTSSLEEVGVDPTELDGILVTHEHSDHIKGLGIAARKYDLPIYANEKTWKAMENSIGKITLDQKFDFPIHSVRQIGDLDIESYGVSHDDRSDVLRLSSRRQQSGDDYRYRLCIGTHEKNN